MFPTDAKSVMALMQKYTTQVPALAAQGAQFVALPEMTALVTDAVSPRVDALFQQAARDAHVQILVGVLHVADHAAYNEGRLYSASGTIEAVYRKHHLVPVLEGRTTPGDGISVLPQPAGTIGIEICRDMDYPSSPAATRARTSDSSSRPRGTRASTRSGMGTCPSCAPSKTASRWCAMPR